MKSRLNSEYFMQIKNKTKKQPDDRNVNQMMCFITKSATFSAPLSLQEGFIFHDPNLLWALPICTLVVFWPIASPGSVPVIPCLWKFMVLQSEE